MRVGVDRDDLCHFHVDVGMDPEYAAQIKSNIVWGEQRGGRLVEQRLELLIVVLVEQRDSDMRIRSQLACTLHSCETTPYDHNVLRAVRLLFGRLSHGYLILKTGNTGISLLMPKLVDQFSTCNRNSSWYCPFHLSRSSLLSVLSARPAVSAYEQGDGDRDV